MDGPTEQVEAFVSGAARQSKGAWLKVYLVSTDQTWEMKPASQEPGRAGMELGKDGGEA